MKPYMTSDDIVEAVERKITIPIAQITYEPEDVLAFANEEMMISQVPSVMQFHEEYFVRTERVPLVSNQQHYPIPERAIGLKLRDMFYADTNDNLSEMVLVGPDDKSYFQNNIGSSNSIRKYYLEGNDVVLLPKMLGAVVGGLEMSFYCRPNQLVPNSRAAISNGFIKNILVDNTTLVAGDTLTINGVVFEAVVAAPTGNQFEIGSSSIITATNLSNTINTNGVVSAMNGTPSTATISTTYRLLSFTFETSNTAAFAISTNEIIQFISVPTNITNGSIIDFLQTRPGHRLYKYGITLGNNAVSATTIEFSAGVVPRDFVVGDYICIESECIIPQIPSDLHIALVERVCARILAAQGDAEALRDQNAKIAEVEQRTGTLIDNRVSGSPYKVFARKSLLRYGKQGFRRKI